MHNSVKRLFTLFIVTILLVCTSGSERLFAQESIDPISELMLEIKSDFRRPSSHTLQPLINGSQSTNQPEISSTGLIENASSSTSNAWWFYAYHRLEGEQLDIFTHPDIASGERDGYYNTFAYREARLTSHPADDYSPELNFDGSKIVFTSERDGQAEIYTINVDGSELTRVTAHPANDFSPTWSPDGKQIMFVSNRAGLPQVHRMNADGSGVAQLSANNATHVYPDWAPDGDRVAWVEIWVDPETEVELRKVQLYYISTGAVGDLSPPLRQAAHTEWSPDGSRIAFDYDAGENFLNDLALVDPSNSQIIVFPISDGSHPYVDYSVVGWQLELNGQITLMAQEIIINIVNNAIDSLDVSVKEVVINNYNDPNSASVRYSANNMPNNTHRYSIANGDIYPPKTQMINPPALMHINGSASQFMWTGTDTGPSGLKSHEAEYRKEGDESWSFLHDEGMLADPIWFTAESSGTYHFRMRGHDHAENVEEYTTDPNGDASVTFYQTIFSGQLTDNRGAGLRDRGVDIANSSKSNVLGDVATSNDGDYLLYLANYGPLTIHNNIGVTVSGSIMRNLYERPPTNLLSNPGFESDTSFWTLYGPNTQTLDGVENAYADQRSAKLQGDCTDVCLDNTVRYTMTGSYLDTPRLNTPYLAVRPDGVIDLAVEGYHQRWTKESGWSTGYPIIDIDSYFADSPLLYDLDGNLHIFHQSVHQYLTVDGVWSRPKEVHISSENSIKAGPDGKLHAVATNNCYDGCPLTYSTFSVDNGWSALQALPNSLVEGTASRVDSVVLEDGTVHVVWDGVYSDPAADNANDEPYNEDPCIIDLEADCTPEEYQQAIDEYEQNVRPPRSGVFYQWRNANGQWSIPADLRMPNVIPDYLKWIDDGNEMYLIEHEDLATTAFAKSIVNQTLSDPLQQSIGWMNVDGAGDLHELYGFGSSGTYSDTGIYRYRFGTLTDGWSDMIEINTGLNIQPEAQDSPEGFDLISEKGILYLADHVSDDHIEIWHNPIAITNSVSAIAQSVTIPADMHKPTLSFMHRIHHMQVDADSHFKVTITSGITQTTVVSTTGNTPWKLGWADLTPWAGETVTVTLALHQTANEMMASVALDEISLSPWTTPIIESISDEKIEAGESTTITITGTNFLEVTSIDLGGQILSNINIVDDEMLTVELPATVVPGSYPLKMVNSSGSSYVAAQVIQIGQRLNFPFFSR